MEERELLHHLLAQSPQDLNNWFQSVANGSLQAPENSQWWRGLIEGITLRANSHLPGEFHPGDLAVQWARLGVQMYEYLIEQSTDDSRRSSLELSLMWLRIHFIEHLGSIQNDSLLDAEKVISWAFRGNPYSLQKLEELTNMWEEVRSQPPVVKTLFEKGEIEVANRVFQVEALREMRLIKNKIAILKVLYESTHVPQKWEKECSDWIRLWEKLP